MNMLIFDWETTGLPLHPNAKPHLQPRVIEFGGILINDRYEVLNELSQLINPGVPLSSEITKITGLSDEHLKDAPSFIQALPAIRDLFLEADIMCAHNLPFDETMLQLELNRTNSNPFNWPPRKLCTAQTFFPIFGARPSMKLLYHHVTGFPLAQTHRALDDCRALAEIVRCTRLMRYFERTLA
jgi:DNA polymerase III epsilon subunit-like protein